MVDNLYYSSRKIPERCENSFCGLQNELPKALLFMRQITKDLNSANCTMQIFVRTPPIKLPTT